MTAAARVHRRTLRLSLLLLLAMPGCGSLPPRPDLPPPAAPVDLDDSNRVQRVLEAQYETWADTPYRWGGMSLDGIDCSAFVYRTFRERLGMTLPRTTAAQSGVGRRVARNRLRPGDLVFFKTAIKQRHVGIYVADGRFLHASTSEGVTLSSLRNPYWAGHYWQARRVSSRLSGNQAVSQGCHDC